jgi:hypothetical protein
MSAVLVRVMACTGLRPQEALGRHWHAVRERRCSSRLPRLSDELCVSRGGLDGFG